jgi:SpoVK/Ycf46/Vps4 family AAA+-type ATPase
MKTPLRPSSKTSAAADVRATVRATDPVSTYLVSEAQKKAVLNQSSLPSVSASHPPRILVTASSREEALTQARRIAARTSSELEHVDLAQVDSKYLRETEKRLLALMDTAEGTSAILFFDEADALFGKRSEVKDAHDRYANLETSYFLQQIENYPGAVIIATTEPARLDPALLKKYAFSEDRPRVKD